MKATELLNLVRARAFGDNSQDYDSSEGSLLDAIIFERRLELAAEGHYFFDLVRTGKAKAAFDEYNNWIATTNPIWNDGVEDIDFAPIQFTKDKNELFSIPLIELELAMQSNAGTKPWLLIFINQFFNFKLIMILLRKGLFILLAATLMVSCGDDDESVVIPTDGDGGTTEESPLAGTWYIASEEASIAVMTADGSTVHWSLPAADVAKRGCLLDDKFIFGADGSFKNEVGDYTWIEPWQGVGSEGVMRQFHQAEVQKVLLNMMEIKLRFLV